MATGDRRKRYTVIEGNRRLLALKALDTPTLITPVLSTTSSRKLVDLADRYAQQPIQDVLCVLFDTEDDALHWIRLRHTGQNQGVGLVEWEAPEKDRFNARHAGARKPAGQLIDFVERRGTLSPAARSSTQKILTNVERLLGTPYAREKLGIDVVQGRVVTLYPAEQIIKGLTRVVEDFKTGKVTVPDLYTLDHRKGYVDQLPRTVLPKRSTRLAEPLVLEDLTTGSRAPRKAPTPKSRRSKATTRTTVIPKSATLDVTVPRINSIYNELLTLTAEQFPNACSVLLRVFIELSVDHYLDQKKVMAAAQMRSVPLAKRLKEAASHLEKAGKITSRLKVAIDKIAGDGKSALAPTIPTFNLYVHNQFVFPRASDLYSTWDEVAPLMEKLWP